LRGEPKVEDDYGKYDSTLGKILFNTASVEKLNEYGDCVFSIQHLKGHSTGAGWMAVSHSFVVGYIGNAIFTSNTF
jgi:hypothetical protein